jgi:signal transduction histidine kinase
MGQRQGIEAGPETGFFRVSQGRGGRARILPSGWYRCARRQQHKHRAPKCAQANRESWSQIEPPKVPSPSLADPAPRTCSERAGCAVRFALRVCARRPARGAACTGYIDAALRDDRGEGAVNKERKNPAAAVPESLGERAAQLSELAANLQTIAEAEKILFARQLHDELGGALVGAKMDLSWLRRRIGSTDPDIVARWDRLERALETGIAFKRRMVEQLRPTLLDNLGFYAAARWLIEEACAEAGLACELDLPLPEPLLTKEVGIALFRILQESLQNVARHAQASRVTIKVRANRPEQTLSLNVADDGVGISPDRLRSLGSHGLGSMHHRMCAVGGQFRVHSVPGQGTEIAVMAPLMEAV